MEIRLAREMGFCFGVKRAVNLVERTALQKGPLSALGALVHNQQVVDRLRGKGVNVVHGLDAVEGDTVVIATHGVPRSVVEEAKQRGLTVVDATCPYVRVIQEKARRLGEAGFQVIMLGDQGHTEVVGVVGWTDGKAYVVGGIEDLDKLPKAKKIGVVAQTTQSVQALERIVTHLVATRLPTTVELVVHNTICNATSLRQSAALELVKAVQVMIVVGGKNSANTLRLAELCREAGTPTYHVEGAAELEPSWFDGCEVVGVTAGASTPDWVIGEVVQALPLLGNAAH